MVRISEIQQFPGFLETFPRNFCTICRCFQIFESFSLMESTLSHFRLASRLFLKKWASARSLIRYFFVLSCKLNLFHMRGFAIALIFLVGGHQSIHSDILKTSQFQKQMMNYNDWPYLSLTNKANKPRSLHYVFKIFAWC